MSTEQALQDELAGLTNEQLVNLCKDRGLALTGAKSVLINRLIKVMRAERGIPAPVRKSPRSQSPELSETASAQNLANASYTGTVPKDTLSISKNYGLPDIEELLSPTDNATVHATYTEEQINQMANLNQNNYIPPKEYYQKKNTLSQHNNLNLNVRNLNWPSDTR